MLKEEWFCLLYFVQRISVFLGVLWYRHDWLLKASLFQYYQNRTLFFVSLELPFLFTSIWKDRFLVKTKQGRFLFWKDISVEEPIIPFIFYLYLETPGWRVFLLQKNFFIMMALFSFLKIWISWGIWNDYNYIVMNSIFEVLGGRIILWFVLWFRNENTFPSSLFSLNRFSLSYSCICMEKIF